MKKLLYTVILILAVICLFAVSAGAAPLWESDTTETVTEGVQLRKLDRFYQNTWDKIRVLYVDLENENLSLRVLTAAEGTSARETTLSMAKRTGAVAAVNGDFFNMYSGPTNMLGMVVQDGALMSSPSKDAGLAGFALLDDNTVTMDYFSFDALLTSPQGYTCELYAINKLPSTGGAITMLTRAWGQRTPGNLNGIAMTEMVVVDGEVEQIRIGEGPIDIPENGYVLVTNSEVNGFLKDNYQVGDAVELTMTVTPEIDNIREATGGGTLLVKDGKVAPFTNNITGYSQRTAIGVDKSGKTLMLVTVDGRLAECEGMNQTELARLLIELGCDTALNLDGGGSTTMVARDRFSGALTVQNTLTGSMRAVSTAIGVFEDAPKSSTASGIAVRASATAVACGAPVEIEYAIYNRYGNNITVQPSKVEITANRPAKISGATVVPLEGGSYTVTVAYGNVRQTVSFESVRDCTDIYLSSQSRRISVGDSYSFTLRAADAYGNSVSIPAKDVQWSVDSDAFTVQNGKVTALSAGSAFLRADFNGMTAYAAIATPGEILYNKPVDIGAQHKNYGEGNGYELYISGYAYAENTLLKRLLNQQRSELLSTQKNAFRLGDYAGEDANVMAVTGFTKQSINNNLLLTVNNANGGIKNTDATQWEKLISAVREATEHSIVIVMPKSVYGLEENEKAVLDAVLAEAVEKGKDVYLVYEGTETDYAMANGVTYLVCGALENAHTKTFFADQQRFAGIKLTLTLRGVKFEFVE